MKRISHFIFLGLLLVLLGAFPVNAQYCGPDPAGVGPTIRCTDCNACGWCLGNGAPTQDQTSCMECLYPGLTPEDTLKIEVNDLASDHYNRPPPPANGKYYTQLGCINTGLDTFTNPSASGSLLNFILTRIIFPTVGVLAFFSLVYGAYVIITGRNSPQQIGRGKTIVISSIVGVLFTFGAIFITTLIGSDFLRIPGFNQGSRITVVAGATCAKEGNPPTNLPECPVMIARIFDAATGNVLDEVEVGEVDGPDFFNDQTQAPVGDQNYTFSSGIKFDPTTMNIAIGMKYDYRYPPEPAPKTEDINLYPRSAEVEGMRCTLFAYNYAACADPQCRNLPVPPNGVYIDTFADCRTWEPI